MIRFIPWVWFVVMLGTAVVVGQAGTDKAAGSSTSKVDVSDQVVLSFITVNGYGNNLYIDNVTLGNQFNTDVAVTSLNNIPRDTSYSFTGTGSFTVAPRATITNLGRTNVVTSFNVMMQVSPGGYSSTRPIASLNSGQSQELTFDSLGITPGTSINITISSGLGSDQNAGNDTLRQYSLILPGAQRNVLFEEWTSSTCAPCAANNPSLDAFIAPRFGTIVPIKYHVGWPSPGNDPMYLYNPTQSYDRRYYYGINAVPTLVVDGVHTQVSGFTVLSNLLNPYNNRRGIGSPLSVSVTDTRLPGDTIQADVAVTILSPLAAGNYWLRVHAVERIIQYGSPPGTNGETIFRDVFRRAYPNSTGTTISTSPGTQHYIIKYKIDTAVWVDSMVYTAAFIQNDVTKEVLNCGKGMNDTLSLAPGVLEVSEVQTREVSLAGDVVAGSGQQIFGGTDGPEGGFNYELFESSFPPAGWRIANPDGGITFARYSGVNGPSFGGTQSAQVDFYSYSTTGQTDTMYSRVYTGLSPTDSVKFDWAYAMYPGYSDRLMVKVSTNGGATFPVTIFDKAGATLATAPSTTSPFVPASSGEWGRFSYSLNGIVSAVRSSPEVPLHFALLQNYPNPFNPATNIEFQISKPGLVSLRVFDLLGREVAVLLNERRDPGNHSVAWNAAGMSSGVYYYRLQSAEGFRTEKMVLAR